MSETAIGFYTFTSPINEEGSWGQRNLSKRTKSTMTLFLGTDNSGRIEWEIPALDYFTDIGLTFEISPTGKRTLVDYDGVMSLPKQAAKLMRMHGIITTGMT